MPPLGALLGLVVGLTLGLLGGGGSVLTVPILVYVLGLETAAAIAGSLAVVGLVSLVGAFRHGRAGRVDVPTAVWFAPPAMVGAYAGARAAAWIPGPAQLALFALVMLVAAAFMLRGRPDVSDEGRRAGAAVVAVTALGVGVLTGVVGVGGGFVIVPSLVLLLRVPMKRAVGTSLLVIAFNAAAGFAGYAGRVTLPVPLLAGFGASAVAGILLGSHLVRYVKPAALRRAFAVFLVVVAVFMLVQNLSP